VQRATPKSGTRSAGDRGLNSNDIYLNFGLSAGVGGRDRFAHFKSLNSILSNHLLYCKTPIRGI